MCSMVVKYWSLLPLLKMCQICSFGVISFSVGTERKYKSVVNPYLKQMLNWCFYQHLFKIWYHYWYIICWWRCSLFKSVVQECWQRYYFEGLVHGSYCSLAGSKIYKVQYMFCDEYRICINAWYIIFILGVVLWPICSAIVIGNIDKPTVYMCICLYVFTLMKCHRQVLGNIWVIYNSWYFAVTCHKSWHC